jgi:mannitol 2-dehydrogenase
VEDRRREQIIATAPKAGHDPLEFLADPTLFGDLVHNERFVAAYLDVLNSLHERGAKETLQWLVHPAVASDIAASLDGGSRRLS